MKESTDAAENERKFERIVRSQSKITVHEMQNNAIL